MSQLKQATFNTDDLVKVGHAPLCTCGRYMAPLNGPTELSGKVFRCPDCNRVTISKDLPFTD